MSSFEDFPERSILAEMRLDIYANDDTGEVNIFYEGEFYKPLTGFEYRAGSRNLIFIFENKLKIPLGAPIDDDGIHTILSAAKDICVFQVTLEGEAGEAEIIPLRVL